MSRKLEFIESYIKHGNGDYEWNDNHGELIRCMYCIYKELYDESTDLLLCWKDSRYHQPDWFCADGEKGGRF